MNHGTIRSSKVCSCAVCDAARIRRNAKATEWRRANADKVKASLKGWRDKNADRMREYAQEWDVKHPGRRSQLASEWRINNRDASRLIHQRRRAAKRGAETRDVTEKDWQRLCGRFRHRCAYCGEKRKLTAEHVIPLSRGGRHAVGNLLPVCKSCNSSKRAKLLIEWKGLTRVVAT